MPAAFNDYIGSIATNALNASNVAANASSIAANASSIAANASNVAANASTIAANASNVATNASNNATNALTIATNAYTAVYSSNAIASLSLSTLGGKLPTTAFSNNTIPASALSNVTLATLGGTLQTSAFSNSSIPSSAIIGGVGGTPFFSTPTYTTSGSGTYVANTWYTVIPLNALVNGGIYIVQLGLLSSVGDDPWEVKAAFTQIAYSTNSANTVNGLSGAAVPTVMHAPNDNSSDWQIKVRGSVGQWGAISGVQFSINAGLSGTWNYTIKAYRIA